MEDEYYERYMKLKRKYDELATVTDLLIVDVRSRMLENEKFRCVYMRLLELVRKTHKGE